VGRVLGTGVVAMSEAENEREIVDPPERELIVAYLSYALDDVRALSQSGLHLLQLTIATLATEAAAEAANREPPVISCH
jgi:hypothetical protein